MSAPATIDSRTVDRVSGLMTGSLHSINVKTQFRYSIIEMEDVNFHFDSAVLLPDYGPQAPQPGTQTQNRITGLGVIYACLKHAEKYSFQQRILVAGHTDKKGTGTYNITLSQFRADNVFRFLKGNRMGWVEVCEKKHKVEDYQQILKWIALNRDWDCDPGPLTNTSNPETREATRKFQTRYNSERPDRRKEGEGWLFTESIPENGAIETKTWGAFFDMYMDELMASLGTDEKNLKTNLDKLQFLQKPTPSSAPSVGCGENFPASKSKTEGENPVDRRVEILFFDEDEEPLLKCHQQATKCLHKECDIYNTTLYQRTPVPADPLPLPSGVVARVFLQLFYLDPEEKKRNIPEGMPVQVVFPDGTMRDEVVGEDGKMTFQVERAKLSFTLSFNVDNTRFVASPTEESPEQKEKLLFEPDVPGAVVDHYRIFRLPKQWSLKDSDWTVTGAQKTYVAPDFDVSDKSKNVGSDGVRVEMALSPHWQHIRFEFFDRKFGHSDHNHKPISVPPVLLEGFRSQPGSPAPTPDVQSNWTIHTDDQEKMRQCLPWIVQKKTDGTAEPKPDKSISLQFKTEAGSFVVSESATVRKIEKIADANRLKPGPDRLMLYDLPALWKSRKFFTRLAGNTGSFFENLTATQMGDSTQPEKPLTFSLDDIVLTGSNLVQLPLGANDPVLLFFHQFKDPAIGSGKPISKEGIYNPGTDTAKPYFPYSDIQMPVPYYIADYPDWTRLVIAQGNLYDVFADRTGDVAGNDVVGARAAVRWLDATKRIPPSTVWRENAAAPPPYVQCTAPDDDPIPRRQVLSRPGITAKPFFSIQPFFSQDEHKTRSEDLSTGKYSEWTSPVPSVAGFVTGRFDMGLLRCCDLSGANELARNFQYFRFHLDFTNAPATNKDNTPFSQSDYKKKMLANIPVRWNGPDTGNPGSFVITAQAADSSSPEVHPFWFVQDTPSPRAHFFVNVISIERANMNGSTGVGNFSRGNEQADSGGGFVAAHECGHGGSLPDEYNERWSHFACSYEFRSFGCNTPADPYSIIPSGPMMFEGVKDIHGRYLWHAAEWSSIATGIPMQVQVTQGATTLKYKVRRHPSAPQRNFTHMPLFIESNAAVAPRGLFDLYLYQLGEDPFRKAIKAGKTFDALLMVLVKMRFSFPQATRHAHIVDCLTSIKSEIDTQLNGKFEASGDLAGEHFDHCLVQFEPRVLVENLVIELTDAANVGYLQGLGYTVTRAAGATPASTNATQADYTNKVNAIDMANVHPRHFRVVVSTGVASGWSGAAALNIQLNVTTAARHTLGPRFWRFFADMVGLNLSAAVAPNNVPTAPNIQSIIVRRAIPGANVSLV